MGLTFPGRLWVLKKEALWLWKSGMCPWGELLGVSEANYPLVRVPEPKFYKSVGNFVLNTLPTYKYIFDHSNQCIVAALPRIHSYSTLYTERRPCLQPLPHPLANCSYLWMVSVLQLMWFHCWWSIFACIFVSLAFRASFGSTFFFLVVITNDMSYSPRTLSLPCSVCAQPSAYPGPIGEVKEA